MIQLLLVVPKESKTKAITKLNSGPETWDWGRASTERSEGLALVEWSINRPANRMMKKQYRSLMQYIVADILTMERWGNYNLALEIMGSEVEM